MKKYIQPSKEQVRAWFAERRNNPGPLPSGEQIRHQLRWYADDASSRISDISNLVKVTQDRRSTP